MNISRQIDTISFFCVLQGGCTKEEAPNLLSCAEHIKDHLNISTNLKWVDEKYCLAADVGKLQKTDIFIFSSFSGTAFKHLSTRSKALIIGPPCLEYCLTQDVNVPLGHSQVFNVAMDSLVVCPSGVPKAEKLEMKKLVEWMGGYFSGDLDLSCTHLVTNTVRSKKYEEAAMKGLPILQPDWVKDVWERNQEQTILARDPIFDRHRLKVFHNLIITSTNLSNPEKEKIKSLIESNGGTYSRVFKTSTVNILILKQDATFSEKYKLSVKFKIDCLRPEWIFESVEKKYAVPIEDFRVSSMNHSTPTKNAENLAHFSMMSNISQISCASAASSKEIDETRRSTMLRPSTSKSPNEEETLKNYTRQNNTLHTPHQSTSKLDTPNQDATFNYKEKLKSLQLTTLKASGAFLDGCQIYLIGFSRTEAMKLNKIISNAGATLYTELSDNISHVVSGDATPSEIKTIHESKIQCKIVTLEWIFESERLRHPADEEKYLMLVKRIPPEPEQPSPASKKSIEAMNSSFKRPEVPRRRLDLGDAPAAVVKKYLPVAPEVTNNGLVSVSQMSNDTYNSDVDADDIEVLTFLQDTTFFLYGYEEEGTSQAIQDVENALGIVVDGTFKGTVDYILVPVDGVEKMDAPVKGTHIVNDLWLEDSMSNRGVVPIMYYHEPIVFDGLKNLLSGIHMSFSNITGSIKLYMAAVAGALGATIREQYPKKETPLLISAKAEGSKYTAALKWKYPVVTEEWLLDTFKQQRVKKIGNYLLGKSTVNESIEIFQRLNQEEECEQSAHDNQENDVVFLGDLTTEGHPSNASLHRSSKRKSDELDSEGDESPHLPKTAEKGKPAEIRTPIRHKRLALLALETPTNKKAADTPVTSQINSLYGDLETPTRNVMRNIIKLNDENDRQKIPGGTVKTPDTPGYLKMPNTPLAFDPKEGPSAQWGAKRRMDTALSMTSNTSRIPASNSPNFLGLRRRYYHTLLGEDRYNEAKRLEGTSQSQASLDPTDLDMPTEGDSVKKLKDFLANNVASSIPKQLVFTENSEPSTDPQMSVNQASEQLVGWVDPSEYRPYKYPVAEPTIKEYNFHITGVSKNKQEIVDLIEKLGGRVLTTEAFDPACTHVVFENLNRGEKSLCAVASGKWILAIKYIQDSSTSGHFLPEENYEVGNQKLPYFSQLKDVEKSVAKSAYRWRQKIEGRIPGQAAISGAHSGMTCLLLLGQQSGPIGRMIEAGKGKVLQMKAPFCEKTEAQTITHVFVKNSRDHGLSNADIKFFRLNGTQILTQKFLTAHLLEDFAPNPADFTI